MPLEAKFAPRPAKVAGRVYPSDHPRVNCAFSGVLSAATTVAGLCRSSSPPHRRASPDELDFRFRGDLSRRFFRDGHSHSLWAAATILYWVWWNGPGTLMRSARVWPRSVIRARV